MSDPKPLNVLFLCTQDGGTDREVQGLGFRV